ncbi:DUF3574 domain-containing protein [Kordia sp. YSTF-M3]|uniref:DUF3574 domain-containing protein n=1 Tax=Kordia aestuariivivens TaxID=2759037 RepID=A0ABR7Q911_9FLAO|nr:DUF3574 domain-containing protein [Kordia aestuariivivens]MBC8755052.1 DUF3574 domain-containing protein [Kordia aestuariivivens]
MSKSIRIFTLLVIAFIVFSCSSSKFQSNYIKTELYFGLSEGNRTISENEWNAFKVEFLDKKFSGYTEINSKGFWTDSMNVTVSENSKLVIYLNKGTKSDSLAIAYVINNYKKKFNQEAILKVETPVNASF